ncbi:HNH endonuclease [Streptococcus suis]|uniref:Putative HNH nuclease YajD n=1 Tax=Streptococcus suis TaxID=1307 RepID=A0A0Z8HJU7_STRSU|nr:HNH endonuclease signature motif containing protein [Streptococcus suis]NQG42594.1 HNH endonuclease [Streptococcus suis]NQG70280.1 HNH endonuclease [Streptococcus suis]NQG72664.1 HNH endonuclease [Streptococcus suis]NQH22536.1 HNH endonuclease [Streptococcus suis]NQH27095.1 HNH endonuclease [Streptococcus suis]
MKSNPFYKTYKWQQKRLEALKRDKYRCVWCYEAGKLTTTRLEVDHIEELEKNPDKALDLTNLRTLCKDCHNKRHNRFKSSKKQWNDEQFEW